MRLFAQERLMSIFNSLGVSEDEQIEHKMLSKAIETAQKKIETITLVSEAIFLNMIRL